MIKALMISILFALSSFTFAIEVSELNPVQTLTVKPKNFKEAIEFNITLPQSYQKNTNKEYFIIFDLHPRSQPYLSGLHDWLSHNGEWPWVETIVVTQANYHPELAKMFENTVSNPEKQDILDFFEFDLLNAIDKKYRTNGFRIYSGFMGNGALGLYALLNRPELFNAYIIASPTLADDFAAVSSTANTKLAKLTDRLRFLYLSIGEHGYEKNHVPAVESFAQALTESAPQQLAWTFVRNNENYYMSRPVIAVVNGIEALFDDIHSNLAADSQISSRGPKAIIDHYALLSEKKYGFPVSAEGSLKNLAKSLMANSPQQALEIYQQTTELYPESAYAFSALAKAYAELEDYNSAVKYQAQAVEKSKSMGTWHQNKHNQYLTEYQQKLNK